MPETGEPEPLSEPVVALLRAPSTWAEPPAGLEHDVLAALRHERDAGRAGPVTGPAVPPPVVRPLRPRRAHPRRSSLLLLAAAAVVLATVAAVGGYVWLGTANRPLYSVALAATAPSTASGTAAIRDTPSGFEVTLDLTGLPPAPTGTYYQGWLKNQAGALVTIGTFHARGGGHDVVLWSGVDPALYPTLTVTLQTEGGGPQSSGKVVLKGTVAGG